jgi:hypothetical protein
MNKALYWIKNGNILLQLKYEFEKDRIPYFILFP